MLGSLAFGSSLLKMLAELGKSSSEEEEEEDIGIEYLYLLFLETLTEIELIQKAIQFFLFLIIFEMTFGSIFYFGFSVLFFLFLFGSFAFVFCFGF